jgi:radical SAM protein with 4Fe4S-binding SPASM domain
MDFTRLGFLRGKKAIPKTICPVPWVNLSIDVDGSSRPCCKFTHQSEDSRYKFANLKENTLEEVWNSDSMVSLRRDFLAGNKPKECNACWSEEKAGVKSYRQTFLEGRTDKIVEFENVLPDAPITLDLKLSNVCNLKCRICGPVASSLWLKEELAQTYNEGYAFKAYLEEKKKYFLSNKITDTEQNKATLVGWLRNINHIEITGGEPLLSPENKWLLDTLINQGSPSETTLLYNTNTTIFDLKTIEKWNQFKKVTVCLSIDDIERRFEYQRAPAKWETARNNVRLYIEQASQQLLVIPFCSVSIFNVLYLPEYLTWITAMKQDIDVYLNYVHYDRHFCVQVMPVELKKVVEEKLKKYIKDENPSKLLSNKIIDLLNFMKQEAKDGPKEWRKFIRVTALRDKIRAETFSTTFPELYTHMVRLNLTEPVSTMEAVIGKIKGNEPETF